MTPDYSFQADVIAKAERQLAGAEKVAGLADRQRQNGHGHRDRQGRSRPT
jgi:hypothetical protein